MFHEKNRKRFCERMQGELVVLTAYDEMQQSGDMAAPFLQQSSFWWLTGIEEPGWKLILDCARNQATLVRPKRSHIDVIFNGETNDAVVCAVSGISTIITSRDFEPQLRQLHRHHTVVSTISSKTEVNDFVQNPALHALETTLERVFDSVQDCSKTLTELRAIKQADELTRMQAAIRLTCDAFSAVHDHFDEFKTEAAIEAEFIYRFHRVGAVHAYEPIVASGEHACTLHYIANHGKVSSRQMVLIDIGARVNGYCADVTRTYCQNPTKRQQEVYDAVERAHKAVIALIAPDLPVMEYIQQVDVIMKRALMEVGLLRDASDTATYRTYFPHAISHGLGVDTHDSLGQPRYLMPGMVLTVEPGIYIPEERIGIRIEDDILVTKNGRKNLSGMLPTVLDTMK